jgi:hypothetical protein
LIHRNGVRQLIARILDALKSSNNNPDPAEVFRLYRNLCAVAGKLKTRYATRDLYTRSVFEDLVAAATVLATRAGFISA